ncbi:MAG: glycosyltransferase family 87 protein [Nitrospinota bacterium]
MTLNAPAGKGEQGRRNKRVGQKKWAQILWAALLAYSVLRFVSGGIYTPARVITGDFYSAFPGPFVKAYNPALFREAVFGDSLISHEGWWNYGPGFHVVTLPLTLLTPYPIIDLLTLCALWGLAGAAFWLCGRKLLSLSGWKEWALLGVIWLNFTPLYAAFGQRAVEILELFLIIWAFAYWGRPVLGGAAIGLSATLKFLPAIFLPYLAWKRRWKALAAAAIVAATVLVATWPLLPWSRSWTLAEYRVTALGGGHKLTHLNNQALVNLIQRLFLERRHEGVWLEIRDSERVRRFAGWVNLAALAALALYGVFRIRSSMPGPLALECGIVLLTMVMLFYRNQTYYLSFALAGISAAAIQLLREPAHASARGVGFRSRLAWAAALALAYGMMSPVIPLGLIDRMLGAPPSTALNWWKLWGGPGLGGVILLIVLVGLHSRALKLEGARVR